MIERCLLDMDGVMTDLVGALCSRYNETYDLILPPGLHSPYDIGTLFGRSKHKMFESLDYEFWSTLPKTTNADEIVSSVIEIFGFSNICICTSITSSSPGCYDGKMKWLQTNYPNLAKKVMTIGPKQFAASPDCLLVDDCESKTDAFRNARGNVILVPRRWNSLVMFEGVSGYVGMAIRLVLKNDR